MKKLAGVAGRTHIKYRRREPLSPAHTEQQLHRLNRTLRAISSANQAIIRIRDRDALLQEICRILVEERDYQGVWIGDYQGENHTFRPAACAGNCESPTGSKINCTESDASACIARSTYTTTARWICNGTTNNDRRCITTIPILIRGRQVALLTACSIDPDAFDEEELALLDELTGDVGFALERLEIEARQREAEEALRASEGRFRNLSENAPMGIALIQDQGFRYVNPAMARMYGYDPEMLVGHLGLMDITASENRESLAEMARQIISGELMRVHLSSRGRRQDGSTFDVEIQGARIAHTRRPAMIATFLDITEREQNRRYRETLTQAGLTISRAQTISEALETTVNLAIQILPSQGANLILTENGRIQEIAHRGYDGIYAPILNAFPIGADIQTIPILRTMAELRNPLIILDTQRSDLWAGRPEAMPIRSYVGVPLIIRRTIIGYLNLDGLQVRPTEADYQRLKLFSDSIAVTLENLKLVDSLKEERNRLALLYNLSQSLGESLELPEVAQRALYQAGQALHALRGVLFLHDQESGTLVPIAGQGLDEQTLLDIQIQTNHDGGIGLAYAVARSRITACVGNVDENPDWVFIAGADEDVKSALYVTLELHGELIGVLGLVSDRLNGFSEQDQRLVEALCVPVTLALQNALYFTQSQNHAEQLAHALERQQELDQLKDEFIQNVSHELRTPLALIMGYAEMLSSGALGPLQPDQAKPIEIITVRSRMLRQLVESIALLWQLERRDTKPRVLEQIDLTQLVQTMTEEFQSTVTKANLKLESEVINESLIIEGELIEIKRVLDNLLGNALKFTPAGGLIKVTLQRCPEGACLKVYDTGIGIPPEKLQRIFERFYQVDGSATRRYGGMGLGLALVKAIVTAHQGHVWAESPVNNDSQHPGSCMTVVLPLSYNLS